MKTARFQDVVAKCGRPELHLTWSAPASDQVLQTALKQQRVLTVYQQTRGPKKDHGVVGLEAAPHAQYLIFPKSLRGFAERKIIGINYDLLREGLSTGGKLPRPRAPRKVAAPARSKKVVRFEMPEPVLPPRPPRSTPAPKAPPARPERFPEPEETDPVKQGIRQAIGELKAGHPLKARKRLETLLKTPTRPSG